MARRAVYAKLLRLKLSPWRDRKWLTYLFFLLLSASFWLFLTIEEEYEQEIEVG